MSSLRAVCCGKSNSGVRTERVSIHRYTRALHSVAPPLTSKCPPRCPPWPPSRPSRADPPRPAFLPSSGPLWRRLRSSPQTSSCRRRPSRRGGSGEGCQLELDGLFTLAGENGNEEISRSGSTLHTYPVRKSTLYVVMEFCLAQAIIRRLGLETRSAHVAIRLDPGITSGAVLNARAKTMTSLAIVTLTSARVGAPTRCVPPACPSYCPSRHPGEIHRNSLSCSPPERR